MSAYEDDADRLADHVPQYCDDPYCQLCLEEQQRKAKTERAISEHRATAHPKARQGARLTRPK